MDNKNHIFPFLWLRDQSEEVLRTEMLWRSSIHRAGCAKGVQPVRTGTRNNGTIGDVWRD